METTTKSIYEVLAEMDKLSSYDILNYKGNEVSFNGMTLLSETFVNCKKGEHSISMIAAGHLFKGTDKDEILNSPEYKYLQTKYFRLTPEWFFVLPK